MEGVSPFGFCFDLFYQRSEFAFLEGGDQRIVLGHNSEVLERLWEVAARHREQSFDGWLGSGPWRWRAVLSISREDCSQLLQQILDGSVGVNELRSSLSSDARDTWNIVCAVASQRENFSNL